MKFTWTYFLLITTLVVSTLFFSCASGPETTDTGDMGEEKVTVTDKAKYETQVVDTYVVSLESFFLNDGAQNGYKEYSFDRKGNLVSMANYRGSGDLLFEEEYTLDDKGRTEKSELFDSEGLTSYTDFTYGENPLPLEEEYFSNKNDYLSGSIYEYDRRGNKTLWQSLDENKTLVLKAEYQYRGDTLLKVLFLTPLNKGDGTIEYTYSADQLIKEVSVNAQGREERRTEYEYDGDILLKTKLFQQGRLSRSNEMEYDEMGNLIKMTTYNRSGNLIGTTQYEYLQFSKEIQVLVK